MATPVAASATARATRPRQATDGAAGVDGWYGTNTEHAVTSLQTSELPEPDGTLGAKTWHKLRTTVPPAKR
ncbi:peptidoglycan-binding domain-containing protein [Streptomyces sp. NPDC003480]